VTDVETADIVRRQPIACALGRSDLATQRERWKRLSAEAGLARVETPDGLRLTFRDEPGVAEELEALVAVERDCCAWADWSVARDERVLAMHVSSTGAGIATLHGMFGGQAP
jgi:hypothetical protein